MMALDPRPSRAYRRFRKRPVEVEAVRWKNWNTSEIADFMGGSPVFGSDGQGAAWVDIATLEGTMRADDGDWIIKGVQGEFYPCKPDIFDATYERVAAANVINVQPVRVVIDGKEAWL